VLHRTSIGCYERTLALLIEKYAGALPTWLAPVQVKILAMTDRNHGRSNEIKNELEKRGIRVECDLRSEKIGFKIRESQMQKVPYMLIIGDKEEENNVVAVRSRKAGDIGTMALTDFIQKIREEIDVKAHD
jgi:threonyl-tRNA synthetase